MKKLLAICGIKSKRSAVWLFIGSSTILSLGIYQAFTYTRTFPVHQTQWLFFILENGVLFILLILCFFSLWLLFSVKGKGLIKEIEQELN